MNTRHFSKSRKHAARTRFRTVLVSAVLFLAGLMLGRKAAGFQLPVTTVPPATAYWLVLYRKSGTELLYYGIPGDYRSAFPVRSFPVKSGIPGQRPTPLPQRMGRQYWLITGKHDSGDDPDTAPYFLTLDIPVSDGPPYGPVPYLECGGQCNWTVPGAFGLHGVGNDPGRLSADDPGSSGCVRHTDRDITFLYTLLDPGRDDIRYYVVDN